MGVKLYGIPLSTPTAAVMTCLAEKEVEYELVPVNLSTGEHKTPTHLAKNPFGKIPALEDGSITLFESRAITAYISHKYQSGTDLFRHDNIEEAAMVGVWVEVESQQFSPPIGSIIYEILVKPYTGQTTDQSAVDANVVKLSSVLDVYEARLSSSKYLACDSFTLADLHHLPYIYYLLKTPHADLITSRPHVNAWWEDISARPSFVKVAEQVDAIIAKA
ncbi:hypothetical protein C5167_038258 [Papaver somniferum]|uniref:glutathione transferase n=1 Tax=Papaver somniferum TaxID=3469 RepID=A0A4Y7ID44_PAPSO|nr:glutathione S-transferase F13-like [Papaver somniferum]RZC45309.1 hypothetical protein C5167_038258 [Papaver somniferum]